MAKNGGISSVMGRAIGLAITYVIFGAMWTPMTKIFTSDTMADSPYATIGQIGLYLFIALLPFLVFSPELKDML